MIKHQSKPGIDDCKATYPYKACQKFKTRSLNEFFLDQLPNCCPMLSAILCKKSSRRITTNCKAYLTLIKALQY